MGQRQIADRDGHRWDADDRDGEGAVRFTRDDGTERIRSADRSVDELTDAQLRELLEGGDPGDVPPGPDTDANRSGGYGDAGD